MAGDTKVASDEKAIAKAELVAEVRRLREDEGLSLYAISRKLGKDKGDLSRLGQDHNIRFDSESTRALTETVTSGARLRRARLARDTLEAAVEAVAAVRKAADGRDAKDWALTFAILVDKLDTLTAAERRDYSYDKALESEAFQRIVHGDDALVLRMMGEQ